MRHTVSVLRPPALVLLLALGAAGQPAAPPVVDAHNCYPYDGRYADRITRALASGHPVSIEQDLAWFNGRVVLSHSAKPSGAEPDLETYFFERIAPLMREAIAKNDRAHWPLIYLHFDFKDNRPELLRAVWDILGRYEPWLTTALKPPDPNAPASAAPYTPGPLMALTEDSDAQEAVFYTPLAPGAKLRVFGSAHTVEPPQGLSIQQRLELAVTTPPERMLIERPNAYRRWWNNSWYAVEKGGARQAGEWTASDLARLKSLVDYAHNTGYRIRFYCLDGFTPATNQGWDANYNFGSLESARLRWRAARDAGVDFIATDQYEDLAETLRPPAVQTKPGALLLGGPPYPEAALGWFTMQSGGGDVVILRASASSPNAATAVFAPAHSVETLVVDTPELARDSGIVNRVRNASGLLLAENGDADPSGSPARLWNFSPLAAAVDYVASKGAPVAASGQTLAVFGGLADTAHASSLTSQDALRNPYDPRIQLEAGFFTIPYLGGLLLEGHFTGQNRMGLLQVLLARALADGLVSEAHGIGIDEATALAVEPDGTARVSGTGSVYFLRSTGPPEICKPGVPLHFPALRTVRLGAGERFNLISWSVIN